MFQKQLPEVFYKKIYLKISQYAENPKNFEKLSVGVSF